MLGIIRQSSQKDVGRSFLCHVPDQWKSKVRRKKRSVLEITDKKNLTLTKELENEFGIDSGKLANSNIIEILTICRSMEL